MLYDKKCPNCGLEFRTDRENQTYCCHACGNSGRRSKNPYKNEDFDKSLFWSKRNGVFECPYNVGVGCTVRKCTTCGWNPEVAKARLDKFMGVDYEG